MSDRLEPAPIELGEALDRIALTKLVSAYCHAVDRRDMKLLRSLYHDDATDDHGAMFCGSPDELVAWLPAMLENWQATSHMIGLMNFVIAEDQAEGEIGATAWHRTADGSRDIIAHGRYLDRYSKRDGIWKFAHRSLVLDWSEDRPVDAAGAPGADDGIAAGRAGPDDPVYARLALFRRGREERG